MKRRPKTWPECIGLAIREWRTVHLGTQVEAERRIGVDQATLSRVENGQRRPDYERLYRAGCDLMGLFQRAEQIAAEAGIVACPVSV